MAEQPVPVIVVLAVCRQCVWHVVCDSQHVEALSITVRLVVGCTCNDADVATDCDVTKTLSGLSSLTQLRELCLSALQSGVAQRGGSGSTLLALPAHV